MQAHLRVVVGPKKFDSDIALDSCWSTATNGEFACVISHSDRHGLHLQFCSMNTTSELHHIVITGRLAPGQDPAVFASICRTVRQHVSSRRVKGALLFDGRRFCQWLVGDVTSVRATMASIALDEWHAELSMRLESDCTAEPLPVAWRAGLVAENAMDSLVADSALPADRLLAVVRRMVDTAALNP